MYILVLRDPEGNETEYDLVGEAVLGRDEGVDVTLQNPNVSRRHARLFLEDGLCYVEDLGSSNGTLIDNQTVVGQVVLEPGRVVSIGPFQVWIEEPEASQMPVKSTPSVIPAAGTEIGPGLRAAGPGHELVPASGALAAGGSSDALGHLEGISGAGIGQVYEFFDESTIGRLPGVDIVVDDTSISRKHASIHWVDGAVIVRDLDSANGTFINEIPIYEKQLNEGDILTFGSAAFKVSLYGGHSSLMGIAGGGGKKNGGKGGKASGMPLIRKVLLGLVGVFIIGFGTLAILGREDTSTPAGTDHVVLTKQQEMDDLRVRVFNHMRRGQMQMDAENWQQAKGIFNKVLEIDPINTEARSRLNQVRLEIRMKDIFDEANRHSQMGNLEDAMQTYMQIEAASAYRRRARFQVHQIVERLQSRYDRECRGFVSARNWPQALVSCRGYMDLACQCPDTIVPDVERALNTAERRARVPASDRWRCPTGFEEWMPCHRGVVTDTRHERKIGEKYSNSDVAAAVNRYFTGQLDEAIRELQRLEESRNIDSVQQEKIRRLRMQMVYVQGKFRTGQTALRRNDLEQAYEEWKEVISTDQEILPSGLQSSIRRNAVRQLSAAYHDRGFDRRRQRRFPEAFEFFRKGYEINPDDTRIGESISWLENVAMKNMRSARTCGELRQILRYTMDNPPSVAHQSVLEAMERNRCE